MENQKRNIGVSDLILLVISAGYLTGMLTIFKPCGPKEDGGWMSCHWAGNAVAGVAAVLLVIAIVHMIIPGARTKVGLSIAAIPTAALGAVIPGTLIHLCMMNTMRCHAVMHPAAVILSVLMIAAAILDIIVNSRNAS